MASSLWFYVKSITCLKFLKGAAAIREASSPTGIALGKHKKTPLKLDLPSTSRQNGKYIKDLIL